MLPPHGLSFHKPSTLWPPPPDDLTVKVHDTIRSRVRRVVLGKDAPSKNVLPSPPVSRSSGSPTHGDDHSITLTPNGQTLHLGSTASLPAPNPSVREQTVSLRSADGETLTIEEQIQLYAPNYLLNHPLISPVVSYLGGMPPLLVIASDKEVLRDEIIYL